MIQREQLLMYALYYQGDYRKICRALREKEKVPYLTCPNQYFTILDKEYPKVFLQLRYPPIVVFYQGDLRFLEQPMIAIVGSRDASLYGLNITRKIACSLKEKAVLVSGMAKGIDAAVHSACLKDGHTIGVLGCGIDYIYPPENTMLYETMRKEQLLLSEYPSMVRPYRHHFPFRNRLIAALGEYLIVTEARMKSGTFLTVNEALELNKEIYVVPSPLSEEKSGANFLIQQGANILYDMEELQNLAIGI